MHQRFRSVLFFDFDDAAGGFVITEKGDLSRIDDVVRLMRCIFADRDFNRAFISTVIPLSGKFSPKIWSPIEKPIYVI